MTHSGDKVLRTKDIPGVCPERDRATTVGAGGKFTRNKDSSLYPKVNMVFLRIDWAIVNSAVIRERIEKIHFGRPRKRGSQLVRSKEITMPRFSRPAMLFETAPRFGLKSA
jgi:hypothetical protein